MKWPHLSRDDARDFAALRAGDTAAEDRLVRRHWALVHKVVARCVADRNIHEDAVGIGAIGLLKAVRAFDPDRGLRFATLAYRCVTNEVRRYAIGSALVIAIPPSSGSKRGNARWKAGRDRIGEIRPVNAWIEGPTPSPDQIAEENEEREQQAAFLLDASTGMDRDERTMMALLGRGKVRFSRSGKLLGADSRHAKAAYQRAIERARATATKVAWEGEQWP